MADMAKSIRAISSSGWIIHLLTANNTSTVFFVCVVVVAGAFRRRKKKWARRRTREKTLYKVEPVCSAVTTKASVQLSTPSQEKRQKKKENTFFLWGFCVLFVTAWRQRREKERRQLRTFDQNRKCFVQMLSTPTQPPTLVPASRVRTSSCGHCCCCYSSKETNNTKVTNLLVVSSIAVAVCWHVQRRSPFVLVVVVFYYYFAKSSVVVVSQHRHSRDTQQHQQQAIGRRILRRLETEETRWVALPCREKSYKHGGGGGGAVEADSTTITTLRYAMLCYATTKHKQTTRMWGQFIRAEPSCTERLTRETINKPFGLALARSSHPIPSHQSLRRAITAVCVCVYRMLLLHLERKERI